MTGVYPLVATSVFSMVHCVRVPATYNLPAQWVVASQPYIKCLSPEHRPVALLAVAVAVLFLVGYPFATAVYLWRTRSHWLVMASSDAGVGAVGASPPPHHLPRAMSDIVVAFRWA
jgi:hypothetical protein